MSNSGCILRVIASPINRNVLRNAIHTSRAWQTKVAVVLSGSGVFDGTELHEAAACLVHLSRTGAEVSMFAPNIPQLHVIDHLKGAPSEGETRNVLTESARIARGKVTDLVQLLPQDFDAVVFPGGFGAAKNLSTFAVDGTGMKVNDDVRRVLEGFHAAKKPIGLCCISPVLAANVLKGCEVTVGSDQEEGGRWPFAGAAGAIQEMGSKHIKKDVTEAHVDEANKVVTAPAFMCDTVHYQVFDGIGQMILNVLKLAK